MSTIKKIVKSISKETFLEHIQKGVLSTAAFSKLRCLGFEYLNDSERNYIINQFTEILKFRPNEKQVKELAWELTKRESTL